MTKIRYARVTDARSIAEIHVASWKEVYKKIVPDSILDNLSIDEREKSWISLLNQDVKVLLLEHDNILGFCSFGPSRDDDANPSEVAEITSIYLYPHVWRKGFGRVLLNYAIDEIKKQSYKSISLWVLEGNLQARKFYEDLGFTNSDFVKIDQEEEYTWREVRYLIAIV